MGRADDLAPLLSQHGEPGLSFHQGTIITWDAQTGANEVLVAGSVLTDLPMAQQGPEALTMRAGQVVTLLSWKSSFWILGRVARPDTPEFFSGAMPAISTAFYPVNVHSELRTDTVGSYYSKLVSAHVIHHRKVVIGARAQCSIQFGGTASGGWRLQWYTSPPPNTADPTGGTLMASVTGLVGALGTQYFFGPAEYEWPAGMREATVYVSWEPKLEATSAAGNWASVVPTAFYGTD